MVYSILSTTNITKKFGQLTVKKFSFGKLTFIKFFLVSVFEEPYFRLVVFWNKRRKSASCLFLFEGQLSFGEISSYRAGPAGSAQD